MLSKEEVLKVGHLAKLNVESELERYSEELNKIISSIEVIEKSDCESEIMISSSDEKNRYFVSTSLNLEKEDIFKNAIANDEMFVVVPKVREWVII